VLLVVGVEQRDENACMREDQRWPARWQAHAGDSCGTGMIAFALLRLQPIMHTLTAELLRSPRLPLYVEELKRTLAAEGEKRRRFQASLGADQKAEFINGEVILNPPARLEHTCAEGMLLTLLRAYVESRGLGLVAHEKTMISLTRNDYEPDICFFNKAKARRFKRAQTRFPAPDFVVEILSPSSVQTDRVVKFEDYAAHGVAEYWIIDPAKRTLEQYLLEGTEYRLERRGKGGTVRSRAVEGFEIPVAAVFEPRRNVETLRKLLR
jgi:Uma2 family endonuclease